MTDSNTEVSDRESFLADVRTICLKIAVGRGEFYGKDAVAVAEQYAAFVLAPDDPDAWRLAEAARLRRWAVDLFDKNGAGDARAAAIWDIATDLAEPRS